MDGLGHDHEHQHGFWPMEHYIIELNIDLSQHSKCGIVANMDGSAKCMYIGSEQSALAPS